MIQALTRQWARVLREHEMRSALAGQRAKTGWIDEHRLIWKPRVPARDARVLVYAVATIKAEDDIAEVKTAFKRVEHLVLR